MPLKFDLSKYNNNNIFIETGTYMGDGVNAAINAGFKKIYSIELDDRRYLNCKNIFKDNDNVTILHGDSGKILPKLLETINEEITFWIDAHYCADGAMIGEKWCPLHEELNSIKNHNIKTHTILIDDWRCMENTHVDTNTKKEVGFLGKENCFKRLKEINPEYNFSFENGAIANDVLVCKIY
tara:strand:+ start:48 stop:593 length:546 start_codon:yes stop_codon:yes gene_type:complete